MHRFRKIPTTAFFNHHEAMDTKKQPLKGDLTWRELQVFKLIAEGRTHKEIADQLCIGEATVKTHKKNINKKIDIAEM